MTRLSALGFSAAKPFHSLTHRHSLESNYPILSGIAPRAPVALRAVICSFRPHWLTPGSIRSVYSVSSICLPRLVLTWLIQVDYCGIIAKRLTVSLLEIQMGVLSPLWVRCTNFGLCLRFCSVNCNGNLPSGPAKHNWSLCQAFQLQL